MSVIAPLPPPPLPSDTQAQFSSKAFALVAGLNTFVTQANAAVVAIDADAATATTQVGLATTQVGLATTQAGIATTGANTATTQAGIATTQAGIATTQAGIATTQAGIATTQAGIATTQAQTATAQVQAAAAQALADATAQAVAASASATAAASSVATITAGLAFSSVVTITTSPYTMTAADAGRLIACNTQAGPITVVLPLISGLSAAFMAGVRKISGDGHAVTLQISGTDQLPAGAATQTISAPGAGFTLVPNAATTPDTWGLVGLAGAIRQTAFAYANRGDLRAMATAQSGDQAIVEGLGLFVFAAGSDEPDDDESCFATATGRWLLEAVHWDVVSTWQMPDDDARDVFDEDEPLRFDARFGARVLHGIAVNAITTLASISTASFTGTVTGAAVGDRVLITPRAEIGSTADGTARLAFYGTVSAADTVRITLVNPSAAAAAINPAVIGAGNPWSIAVLKHI